MKTTLNAIPISADRNAQTIEEVVKYIEQQRKWSPFAWGGRFFVVKTEGGFGCYRTKQTAAKHAIEETLWIID